MAQKLMAICTRRHPPADRTEPGQPRVEATFSISNDDGVIGALKLTTTDPLTHAYWLPGKHYEISLTVEQPAATRADMGAEKETV